MSNELAFAIANGLSTHAALVAPQAAMQIAGVLQQLAGTDSEREIKLNAERAEQMMASYGLTPETTDKPKSFAYANGLAFIPVHGMLVNRLGYSWGWITGYNFIRRQMDAALADDDVKGIVFDLNSYGGMVAGCFELSADIAAATKPTLGVVDSACYSACYAIGSACDKLVATPSSGAGSIGVIAMHVNVQKAMEKNGVEVTIIASGDHKADGNPYQALPDNVKKSMQKSVDATRSEFVNLVASNRDMDAKKVHDTEADVYRSSEAVALGLIDAVTSPSKAIAAFFSELSGSNQNEDATMATETKETPKAESSASVTDQQLAEARKSERERMSSITNCEEAKGKTALANHLAFNTTMSVDDAKATLKAAATEEAAPAKKDESADAANPLAEAMKKSGGGANVGADTNKDGGEEEGKKEGAVGSRILSNYNLATGRKPAKA